MDDGALRARLERNFALLERFASSWQAFAATRDPSLARFVPSREPIDIGALQLQPSPAEAGVLSSGGGDHQRGVVAAEAQ
jgi:hypothetical protein